MLDLMRWCMEQIRSGRADRVEQLEQGISRELNRPNLPPERRRDLMLSRLVVLSFLGRTQEADRLFGTVSQEYRGDPVVEHLRNWLRRSAALRRRRPPREGPLREPPR